LTGGAAAVVAAVIAVAAVGSAAWWWTARMPATVLDDRLVVVAPFRVSGADPSLGYLREGMIDLLAAKLTGEGGPRAVNARSVLVAWRRRAPDGRELSENDAREIATTLGSGKLLLGDIVGTPSRLVIHAALLATASGRVLAQESVDGPPDRIASKIDELAAKLLSLDAGQRERLGALSSASLPALREYLDGKAIFRHGQYRVAGQHFTRAVQLDSTFALAVLGVLEATWWSGASADEILPAGARADAMRARLSEKDRAYLAAMIGPRFPEYTPMREFIEASERAAQLAPDQPETWSVLGDWLFHVGGLTDLDEWEQRARTAYQRALAIDSTFAPALGHFVILAARRGDTATVRTLGARFISVDSVGETAQVVRWRRALMLRDAPMLADVRAQLEGAGQPMDRFGAWWIFNLALHDGTGLDDGDRAAVAVQQLLMNPLERMTGALLASDFILERGQPRAAVAASQLARAFPADPHLYLRWRVLGALYAGGDSTAAMEALAVLIPVADASPPRDATARRLQNADRCAVEQWRLMHGDARGVHEALARMRSTNVRGRSPNAARVEVYCDVLLDALAAEVEGRPDAISALDRLDSLMRLGPNGGLLGGAITKEPGNLIVAWLRERHNDLPGALRALRRVGYVGSPVFVSVQLREEGRMAALSGDRAGAMRTFRHYLAIRSNPEPALLGEADAVRNALTLLERGQPPAADLRALSPPIPRPPR
jgi:serine/threonine-protein kinase